MNLKHPLALVIALVALAAPLAAQAQSSVADDFTSTATSNPWYFFNGACLTAGTTAGVEPTSTSAGQVPGCTAIGTSYYNQPLVGGQNGVSGNTQTLPDPDGQGALRFTNGNPGGYSQNGGILSTTPFPTGQGVSITFKTVTYRGDSGGIGAGFTYNDGADGISFFLMDASALNTSTITGTANGDGNGLGSWGGSLGYTCSNSNTPYNGLVGAYLGLGIDEYGNFLNGAQLVAGYAGTNTASGDNSQYGYGRRPNRIGLRGAGNIAWNWLNTNYPALYPNTFTQAQKNSAVQATCKNGVVWDYANNKAYKVSGNTFPLYDYAPIPNAYVELPATSKIANEAAMARGAATTIFYQLKITQNGLLTLSYALCPPVGGCGAYQSVITSQSITASNGPLPANFLFGFAGSTGGSTNIHEILCFKADPVTTAASGAGASEKQSAKLETGAQAYFAFYNPSNWTGRVTASSLGLDTYGNVVIASTPNWDGACTLTGVSSGKTCTTTGVLGPTAAQSPTSRVILTSTGAGTGSGIPFEWASLTSAEQTVLTAGDASPTANRLNYLRGDRTNEINSSGVGLFRKRSNVLADVIDSSPSWVGPPVSPYAVSWVDRLHMSATMPEQGASAQTYQQYVTAQQTRLNVVYVGSNDGLLHGFRTGAYNADGTFNTSSPNDGIEVLAYMPAAVLQTIHSTTANLDYANAQYGHNFFEDATPATGDVFYNNAWHTWVVGGLGAGGSAIFALDVTNAGPGVPTGGTMSAFSEGSASSVVVGEWNGSNITCTNVSNCGQNLGNTYGTPQLRRLHDGRWAVIFGNGLGSATGDAGIFVMTLDPTSAAPTFYYFSTGVGSSGNPNGIAFASPADLDGDHITDYVYAGDLQGNVWRFDLTSTSESGWGLTPGPFFSTGGQPITSALVVASGAPSPGMTPQIMVLFGTGQKVPLSNTQGATYAAGTQSLYGVWDWNMAGWNSAATATYASLPTNSSAVPSSGNHTLGTSNLQQQTVTVNATTGNRDITSNASVCWAGNCASNGKFGWYINFPGTKEQVIFSPELVAQAVTVNSIVPAANSPTSCANLSDTGFTYVLSAMTGNAFNQVFLPPSEAANPLVNSDARYTDNAAIAMQTNATGSSFITGNNAGTKYLVYETNQVQSGSGAGGNIQGGTLGLNLPPNTSGRRLNWIERR
jgi:type IV pilus assembly protein PilY1